MNENILSNINSDTFNYYINTFSDEEIIKIWDNTDKIERVKALFNSSGASKATQDAIQDFTFKAFQTLDKMNISTEKKEMLKAFGENLMGRKV